MVDRRSFEGRMRSMSTDIDLLKRRIPRTRFASIQDTLDGTADNLAVTPEGLAAMNPWIPVIPGDASTLDGTVTVDPNTGLVTFPAGTRRMMIDDFLEDGWEYEISFDGEVNSGHSTDNSCWFRMREGGNANSASGYQTAGYWAQYNAIWGVYSVNGGTIGALGAVSGAGVYVAYTFKANFRRIKTPISKGYFYQFESFTSGSARGTKGGGYTPSATTQFDGIELWFNGSMTGYGRGDVRIYKRRTT